METERKSTHFNKARIGIQDHIIHIYLEESEIHIGNDIPVFLSCKEIYDNLIESKKILGLGGFIHDFLGFQ